MGLADVFGTEDKVSVKFSDFYNLIQEAAKAELITNAVLCDVPHEYARAIITGKKDEITEKDG